MLLIEYATWPNFYFDCQKQTKMKQNKFSANEFARLMFWNIFEDTAPD
jgi:hypothetical protein